MIIRSFLLAGAVSMLIMSSHYYTQENSGILQGKEISSHLLYRFIFYCHITSGLLAIILGPFQFIDKIIQQKKVHRFFGYCYVFFVVCSSISGLILAQFAMGGVITRIGFSLLSIIWFTTIISAINKIRMGDVPSHRQLMKINYALTFSAVTQRTILLFAFIPGFKFIVVYQLSSWLSWIINLLLILYLIKKQKNDTTQLSDNASASIHTTSK